MCLDVVEMNGLTVFPEIWSSIFLFIQWPVKSVPPPFTLTPLSKRIILFEAVEVVVVIRDESIVPVVILDASKLGILAVSMVPVVISDASMEAILSDVRLRF